MELSFEQIRSITANVLSVRKAENGYVEFSRFTERQLDLYGKAFYDRARSTPGACLDFYYDGKTVSFDFLPRYFTSRSFLSFDLYADGVMVYSLYTFRDGDGQTKFEYTFDTAKRRRIQIFFPFSVGFGLRALTLDDGSTFSPVETADRLRMLILGDSITHGYDARQTSLCYATTVARYFDAVALNQAVGGYYFHADMLDEDLDFHPDVITVAYGTNDWGRYGASEEKYRAAAKAYIDKLCAMYPEAKIFGILPIWRADEKIRPERMAFEKIYDILTAYYSAHENVTLIDGREAVPHIREMYTDGLHPNTVGQSIYAQSVIAAMEHAGIRKGNANGKG